MNDDALLEAYILFNESGYNGDINDFHALLREDKEAVEASYDLFKQNGYVDSIDDFKSLMGLDKNLRKNKEQEFLSKLPGLTSGQQTQPDNLQDQLDLQDKNKEAVDGALMGEGELTPGQASLNAFNNAFKTIAGMDDRFAKLYYTVTGDLAGIQAADLELNRLDDEMMPVIEPDQVYESFDDGIDLLDFQKLGAATVNAMTGLGVSMFQRTLGKAAGAVVGGVGGAVGGFATGGLPGAAVGLAGGARVGQRIGGTLGIASDMIASSVIEYNQEKAKEMGVTYEELVKNGDADILAPALVGYLQAELEQFGLKSIGKGIVGRAQKKFIGNLLTVGLENGLQEFGQELGSLVNEEVGRLQGKYDSGEEIDFMEGLSEVSENVWNNPRRLFNATMNGVLGGKGSVILGRTGKLSYEKGSKLITAIRTPEQYQQQEEILEDLVSIENELNDRTVSEKDKEILRESKEGLVDQMQEIQDENVEVINRLDEGETDRVVEIHDELNRISNNIKLIENTDRDLAIKRKYISPLQKKIGDLTTELSNIRKGAQERTPQTESLYETTDAKGRVTTYFSETSERGGVKKTTFFKKRSDKKEDQKFTAQVDPQSVMPKGYEIDPAFVPEGLEVKSIISLTETNSGKGAEVQFVNKDGTRVVNEVALRPKEDTYTVKVDSPQSAIDVMKKLNVQNYELNEEEMTFSLYGDGISDQYDSILSEFEKSGINYESVVTKGPETTQAEIDGDKKQELADATGELTQEQIEVNEIRAIQGKPPKYSTEQTQQSIPYETQDVIEEMNSMDAEVVQFNKPSDLTTDASLNTEYARENLPGLNIIEDFFEYFRDIPMTFTISDELGTRVVEGQEYEGGTGFNTKYPNSAWANTTESTAQGTIKRAVQTYQDNKALFERLWEQGRIPYGHVPMAVIKMGDEGIYNNEALYREAARRISKSIPKRNRIKAQQQLIKLVKDNETVSEFVKKYKTIDETMANITELPLTVRRIIGDLIFTGDINKDTKPGTTSKPVAIEILKGVSEEDKTTIHVRSVRNAIVEPSTESIPQRHVISVVGVDVLNPEVQSLNHRNYGFGVKGTSIGLLKKPVHAMDAFPEMMAKAITMKGSSPAMANKSVGSLIQSAVMANGPVANYGAYRGITAQDKISTMRTLMSQLKLTFPDVAVSSTQQEFTDAINNPEVKKYVKKGDVVYGLTVEENGKPKIYVNPDYATTKVVLHEYSHVWQDYVKENNPELLQAGYNLLEGTDALAKSILEHGDNQLAREEAMAELISNKGETIVQASLKSRFKNWLNALFTYIKSRFKSFNDMSSEDFQNITLDQFVDGALVSMFEGDDKKLKTLKKVRFSKQNISDIMRELVKRKYSQQAIKEALEEDYSSQDIVNAYNEIRAEYQKEQYKNEGLFDPNRNVLSKSLDIIYRKLLSKRGYLSKSQQVEAEMMDGFIQSSLKKASVASNRLTDLVRKTKLKGEKLEELSRNINAVLNGKEAQLPENIRREVVYMRNHIDILQKQLLKGGYLQTISQQQAVANGIGNYITRSYRIFDSDNWANEVSQQVIQKAKNYLRSTDKIQKQAQKLAEDSIMDYQQALDLTVENSIQNILSKSDSVKFVKSAREGAKDMNSLKRRKEIPEPIRALMGEYEDPIQNYNRTIQRVASLVATGKYLNNVRKAGLNVFLFEKNDAARPKEFNTEIAPSTTTSYSPLSGLLTTPEIAEALKREPLLNGQIFNSKLFRGYLKYVAAVKWSKTIASPGTHGKNVFGNLFFMAANGYTNPDAYIKAFDEVKNQIRVNGEMQLSKDLEKYINLGIIDKSIVKTELMEMFGKSDQVNVESLLERQQTRYWSMHKKQWWRGVKKGLEKAYQLEDDFFKIVTFEMELKRYAKAIGKQPFERLTKEQQERVTQIAAENTKNIIPNYNRIGNIREIYRSIPVLGTFISFQLESYRTAYNIINLGLKESRTPGLKSIGAKRLASVIGFQALYHYALTGFVGDIFGAISDDDEDEAEKYARLVRAPWSKNSNTAIIKAGDGKFTYIDFSASNPHGQIDRAIQAMSKGETPAETTVEVIKEALGDFIDYDIAFGAALSIINNEKPTGGQIWQPDDSVGTIIGNVAQVLYKTVEPGLFRSAMKIKGADSKVLETIGQATGYKPTEVDYRKGIEFQSRRIMNEMRDATSLTTLNRQLDNGEITSSAYDKALQRREEYRLEKARELIDLYKGGIFFGLDANEIMEAMVEKGGVSKMIFYQVEDGDVYKTSK